MQRNTLFLVFLTLGALIFAAPILMPTNIAVAYRITLTILLLLSALWLRRHEQLKAYFPIVFTFFTAALVNFLDNFIYSNQSPLTLLISAPRIDLYVIYKVVATTLVATSIILLTKASGRNLASLNLQKGKLHTGLTIGLATFLVFLATSVPAATLVYNGKNLTYTNLLSWAPWIFTFIFANGFKEELQFRGLFLKPFETHLGAEPANLLQAIIFALSHLGETYSPMLLIFIVIVFLLGLAFGAVTQKTHSLIGSILFHAGTDIPVILGIFSNL